MTTAVQNIQVVSCIFLLLIHFQPVRTHNCYNTEVPCMKKATKTTEDARLIVNCGMSYATVKVTQLNTDVNSLLQVEYVCTTQNETDTCILAINHLNLLHNEMYNITIPKGSFCLIRGCIENEWSSYYYYLTTNDIRCDGNVPTPSTTYTRPSSNVNIKTENSYSLNATSLKRQTEFSLTTTVNTIFMKELSSSSSLKEQASMITFSEVANSNGISSPNIANVNIYLIVGILVAFIFTIATCFGAVTVYAFVSKRMKRANKEEYYISSYFARPSIVSDFTNEVKVKAFENSPSMITLYSPFYYSDLVGVSCDNITNSPEGVCTGNVQSYLQADLISPVHRATMQEMAYNGTNNNNHHSEYFSIDQTVDESSYINFEETSINAEENKHYNISGTKAARNCYLGCGLFHAHSLCNIPETSIPHPVRHHLIATVKPNQCKQDFSLESTDVGTNSLVPLRHYSLSLPSLSSNLLQSSQCFQ